MTCGKEVERRLLDSHMRKCKYRQYKCEHCGYSDTYDAIAGSGKYKNKNSEVNSHTGNHYKTCDHFPLECVNKCCKKNIKRKDMKSHRDVCPLEVLKCPFSSSCTKNIVRRDMEKHKKQCEFRPFSCEYCGSSGTFSSITGKGETPLKEKPHYSVCEHYPLDCPNNCGAVNIKRRNVPTHREKCPFKFAKCTSAVLRKDMEDHCQKNMQQHLLLLAHSHQELAKSHQELAHKNLALLQRNEELTQQIHRVTRQNELLAKQFSPALAQVVRKLT